MNIEVNREISTYFADENNSCRAVVKCDIIKNEYFIDYYEGETRLLTEVFPGFSLQYVEDAAENWALGIKKDTMLLLEKMRQ